MVKTSSKVAPGMVVLTIVGLAIGLASSPSFVRFVFPISTVLVLILFATNNAKSASLLAGAVSFLCLTMLGTLPFVPRFITVACIGALWIIWGLTRKFSFRMFSLRENHLTGLTEIKNKIGEAEKERDFYLNRKNSLEVKVSKRRRLLFAAREMGGLVNASQIRDKLLELMQNAFPGAQMKFSPGLPSDQVDCWVIERCRPLLVEDFTKDPRFKLEPAINVRSAMAVPVMAQGQVVGVARLDAAASGAFTQDDLRFLDLLGGVASLALDNAALFSRVEQLAVRDGLTNLFTHRVFQERLGEELLRAGRYRYTLSLIMLDIDHFKQINDVHGHAAGDAVLVKVAQIIMNYLRAVDVPARYGGEEFTIVLPELGLEEASKLAERIRLSIAGEKIPVESKTLNVTASFGVASFPLETTTAQQLLRLSDERMYKAKQSGRNRVVNG